MNAEEKQVQADVTQTDAKTVEVRVKDPDRFAPPANRKQRRDAKHRRGYYAK